MQAARSRNSRNFCHAPLQYFTPQPQGFFPRTYGPLRQKFTHLVQIFKIPAYFCRYIRPEFSKYELASFIEIKTAKENGHETAY